MDEVKNMLDYKVGHYVHQHTLTYDQRKNILRSFMFIKQKFFPDGSMDKLKARLVADGSQQGRHLYEFVSSATVSLQVVYLLFNIASHYKCMLQTVDIRGAFLNAEFTPADKLINLKINKDVVRPFSSALRIRQWRVITTIRSILIWFKTITSQVPTPSDEDSDRCCLYAVHP